MIKKKTKERKYRSKKIKGGVGNELNIGPFVPEQYAIMKDDDLERLKKIYERDRDEANEIAEKKREEYNKNQQLLQEKRESDIKEHGIESASYSKFWQRVYLYIRLILKNIGSAIGFIVNLFKTFISWGSRFGKWFIYKISSIFHVIWVTCGYIANYIGNTIIGKLLVRFIEGVVYTVKYMLDTFWGFCKWLGSTEIFSNLLFFKGPVPRIIWAIVLVAIVLGFILGWGIPKTTSVNNAMANSTPKYDGGILSTTDGTSGDSSAGTSTGSSTDPTATQKTVLDSSPDDEYFSSSDKIFANFKNDPIDFIYKLIIYVQTKIKDSILPPEFMRTCLSSLRQLTDSIKRITNQPTTADDYSIQRDDIKTGRPDNIYNIDLSLIHNDGTINNINDILNSPEHNNNVYSIARPKDIEWKMPNLNYKNSDFSLLPDSIKNMVPPGSKLSLNDKKSLTIPWKKNGLNNAIYELSCADIYYTNSNISIDSIDNKPDILRHKDDTTCIIAENEPTKNLDNQNRHYNYKALDEYTTSTPHIVPVLPSLPSPPSLSSGSIPVINNPYVPPISFIPHT